jgi:hypothetical protein
MVYPNGYKCFGCGARGPLSDLGLAGEAEIERPPPEDLAAAFDYIASLPVREVRGLLLPCDERSYYIVWPDRDYYKRRFFTSHGSKYIGATGHKKPWFWARGGGSTVVVIEGELNCLSVAEATPYACVSPGGAGDFSSAQAKKNLPSIIQYDTILVVADADAAGAKAVIDLYGEIAGRGKTAKTLLMPTDANEVLQQRGKEELRQEIERGLGTALEKGA